MTDAELWCEGRPFCGRRPLQEVEVGDLEERIARTRRRMTLTDRFAAGGISLLVIGAVIAMASYRALGITSTDDILTALAVFFLGLGCLGSLLEVFLAPRWSNRIVFAVGLVLFCLGAAAGEEPQSPIVEGVLTLAIIIVLIGGSTMMALRWRDRRRLRPVLTQALEDCRLGDVMLFGADTQPEIEMLPTSHLALKVGGDPFVEWKVLYVTSVSRTPPSFEAPVIGQTGQQVTSGRFVYNQRHMSAEEIVELGTIRKRSIRKGIVSTAAVTYTCAVLFTAFGDRPTTVRWLFAALLGAMYLQKQWRVWRNLRMDVATSMILVVRSNDEAEASVSLAEVLPASHLEWTKNGNPSRWRVAKW